MISKISRKWLPMKHKQFKVSVHIEYVADIYTYTIFVGTYQTHQSHIEL